MKKTLIYGTILLMLLNLTWSVGFAVAAQNQPAFFVPQKVLQKMNQPEQLPSVEQMTFDGKQAPIVIEMQQKARAEAEKKRQEQLAQQSKSAQNTRSESEKKQTKIPDRAKVTQTSPKTAQKSTPAVKLKTRTPANNPSLAYPNIPVAENVPAQLSPQAVDTPPAPVLTNAQRTFDDIIADYKRDIQGISAGRPVNNPRLLEVLQDYNDEFHVL